MSTVCTIPFILYRRRPGARQPFPGDPIRTFGAIHLASVLVARSAVADSNCLVWTIASVKPLNDLAFGSVRNPNGVFSRSCIVRAAAQAQSAGSCLRATAAMRSAAGQSAEHEDARENIPLVNRDCAIIRRWSARQEVSSERAPFARR